MTDKFIIKESLKTLTGTAIAVFLVILCIGYMNVSSTASFVIGWIALCMVVLVFVLFIKNLVIRIIAEFSKNKNEPIEKE